MPQRLRLHFPPFTAMCESCESSTGKKNKCALLGSGTVGIVSFFPIVLIAAGISWLRYRLAAKPQFWIAWVICFPLWYQYASCQCCSEHMTQHQLNRHPCALYKLSDHIGRLSKKKKGSLTRHRQACQSGKSQAVARIRLLLCNELLFLLVQLYLNAATPIRKAQPLTPFSEMMI